LESVGTISFANFEQGHSRGQEARRRRAREIDELIPESAALSEVEGASIDKEGGS
jgi:hypothetical protein